MPDLLERLKSAFVGRYAIESEIGRGGMAVVYLAHDLRHERRVAIKVLHPELTATLAGERFLQEIRIVAGLQHPHILPLYDSGAADGLLYYVMPFAEGESLRRRLDRERQLGVDGAVRIAIEVADGLDYAHRKGVIHRDIKPGNILLAEGHATIADFGIARAVEAARAERVTRTGLGVGTPLYASPEQATGEEALDGRTDIYSLGCVLYEMLAGEPPLTGATPQMIQARRMSETPTSLHTIRDTVPPVLDQVIGRALARVPADRYETAGDFGKTLQSALLATTPAEVVPAGDWKTPARPRSRLWRAGLAAVLGTALVTAVLLTSVRWSRTEFLRITVSNATQVTTDPGVEYQPAISPDGREVAYVEGGVRSSRVVVRSTVAEGGRGGVRPAEDLSAGQRLPSWTPDGASIRFCAALPNGCEWKQVGKLGGFVQTINMPRVSNKYAWSRDGTRAVFAMNDSIFAVSTDNGDLQLLGVHVDEQGMHSFAWSPDGRRIAYVLGNPGWRSVPNTADASIWVLDIGSDAPVRITTDGMSVSPQWLPGGRHLLFISDVDGVRGIHVVEVGRQGPLSPPRPVLPSSDPHSISISDDGRKLAYSQYTARQNIWSIPIPASGTVSLSDAVRETDGNQVVEMHSLSRDGTWIAFDSRRRGESDIYKQRTDGGEQQLVGDLDENAFMPDWSPDGSELVFYSGSGDILTVSADGGTPRVIADTPGFHYGPRWSPDGLAIAFESDWPQGDDRFELRIVTRDSVGGPWSEPVELTDFSCAHPDWAPDGQSLVCNDGGGWVRVSRTGAVLSRYDASVDGLRGPEQPRFSPDGSRVYFVSFSENGPRGVWWTPSNGGRATRVATFGHPSMIVYGHISVGPDDLYLTVGEWESDIRVVDLEW